MSSRHFFTTICIKTSYDYRIISMLWNILTYLDLYEQHNTE